MVISVTVLILLISTVTGALFSFSHLGHKSIKVDPIGQYITAQYQTREPFIVTSNFEFASLGATGVGTPSDPYVFENLEITDEGSCIQVENTTAHFVISNCKLESGNLHPTIRFYNVENGRVEQCEAIGGSSGLELVESQDCLIQENYFYDCWNGINLFSTFTSTIIENSIHNNHKGIVVYQSDSCLILNNLIYSNLERGVEIAYLSYNNTIYGNSIGWNDVQSAEEKNAFDSGVNNTFDDGASIGNFWSDYNESEIYAIAGIGGSIDQFAQLLKDEENPSVLGLMDIAIDVDSYGNTLTWTVYDMYPASYIVEENELQTVFAAWEGSEISYGLDYLQVGTHAITLILYDGAGNTVSDGVFVTVVSRVLGGIGTEFVMIASGITVACFVIIIFIIKRLS